MVDSFSGEITRVAFIAIRAIECKLYTFAKNTGIPNFVGEAFGTAVKCVRPVVDAELVLIAVNGEFAEGNAVGISSWDFACAWSVVEVVFYVFITEYHVGQRAVSVVDIDGSDAGADCAEADGCSAGVGDGKRLYIALGGGDDIFSYIHDEYELG